MTCRTLPIGYSFALEECDNNESIYVYRKNIKTKKCQYQIAALL